jgi:hypothetical protein
MPEGERAQQRSQRGRGHHPVAGHRSRRPGPQHVDVVDRVSPGHQSVHQREHLAAGPVSARPVTEVDHLVDHRFDPKRRVSVAGSTSPALATA